jgi:hypothetical protein
MYGIASPAPICTDDTTQPDAAQLECQVVQAPESSERLVPHAPALSDFPIDRLIDARPSGTPPGAIPPTGTDGEIRLTYRELTALIEDALRALR